MGLRWKNVDLAAGTFYVCESLEATRTGLDFKSPKNKKSKRLISLGPSIVDALRRHKVDQAKQKLKLEPAYQDNDLVCPGPGGRPWNPNSLSPAFRTLIRRTELPRIRFHDLRHTHATSLLRHNVHPKIVSERLGHAKIGTTLDTYRHVLPGMQEEAARIYDAVLQAASE